MRLEEPFVYRITEVRDPPAIFKFIRRAGPVDTREAYATFNMGAGFAVYVRPADVPACLASRTDAGYDAWHAGQVTKSGHRKAVEIIPLGITFQAESLQVR